MNTAIVPSRQSIQAQAHLHPPLALPGVPTQAQANLLRMFADPRVLAKEEIVELIEQLSGLQIALFFISIGISSDCRAPAGDWGLMLLILCVAIIGKVIGCRTAALGSGMDWVRSLRVDLGMMSRGEVGLIVTAMGASSGIFGRVPKLP